MNGKTLLSWGILVLPTFLIGVAAFGAAASDHHTSQEAAARIAAGDAAMTAFDLERAQLAYRGARESVPDSPEAAWKLARALTDQAALSTNAQERKRLCTEAATAAREAIRLDPSAAMGYSQLAVALGKLARRESGRRQVELARETRAVADMALRINPDDDIALHVLGVWNREVSEINPLLRFTAQLLYGSLPPASFEAAIAHLRRAVELRPAAIPHHIELGVTLAGAGNWTEARDRLERGLALPDGYAIDRYYREYARRTLASVNQRLQESAKP